VEINPSKQGKIRQMATKGMILAVEIDAVKRFLHRVFLKGGAEVIRNGRRGIQVDFVAE